MDFKAEYELSELENKNLRKILEWCAQRIPEGERIELGKLLERTIDDGGVVEDGGREAAEEAALFEKIADHFSPVENIRNQHGQDFPGNWYLIADRLISECRAREGNRQLPIVDQCRDLVP
jgi:hypothetical protein